MDVVGFLILFLTFPPTLLPAKAAGVLPKNLGFSSANSTFRIAVFADLHYGENAWTDWGPRQDQNSDLVISSVLNMENPDFVVYLGDLVTANNLPMPNASKYWEQAISSTRNKNIPWATLFGNHDDTAFEWPEDGLEAWEFLAFSARVLNQQQEVSKWLIAISEGQPVPS